MLLCARAYDLTAKVCGEGCSLHEVAGKDKRQRIVAADMLRVSLNDLAGLWGLSARRAYRLP